MPDLASISYPDRSRRKNRYYWRQAGIRQPYEYPYELRQMAPGEWLCVVSDGITEAMNPRRKFYGAERLASQLAELPGSVAPRDIIAAIDADVRRFAGAAEQFDDITVLCLRWNGPAAAPAATATGS